MKPAPADLTPDDLPDDLPELAALVRQRIHAAGGWLPFDAFMALVLYAPGLGYYANATPKFGLMPSSGSDFVTAPELSPLFGRCLAAQVAQGLSACASACVTEFGAGSGALAEQLLDSLDAGAKTGAAPASYQIIELSAELRQRQQARLARFGPRVRWLDRLPEVIDGVVIGNELLDAMPVKLLAWDGAAWSERGVVARGAGLGWADRATDLRPPLEPAFGAGAVTEIQPQAQAFVRSLAERLRRGLVLLIDYGFPEAEYYHPQRSAGTLMCHRAHRADTDPLVALGRKDITSHIDFSAIALAAQDSGLAVLGYTSQGRFLINCGLAGLLQAASLPEQVMAQRLIAEHEMGELFKVIALGRGCAAELIGFSQGDRTHRL